MATLSRSLAAVLIFTCAGVPAAPASAETKSLSDDELFRRSEARSDYRSALRRGALDEARALEAKHGRAVLAIDFSALLVEMAAAASKLAASNPALAGVDADAPGAGKVSVCGTEAFLFLADRGALPPDSVLATVAAESCSDTVAAVISSATDKAVSDSVRTAIARSVAVAASGPPAVPSLLTEAVLRDEAQRRCGLNPPRESLCEMERALDAERARRKAAAAEKRAADRERDRDALRLQFLDIACRAKEAIAEAKAGMLHEKRVAKVAGTAVSAEALRAHARNQIAAEEIKRGAEENYRELMSVPLPYSECAPADR